MASRLLDASGVLDRVFDDDFGLSDSEDSDDGGAGVYSYLPMDSLGSGDDGEQLDGSRESGDHIDGDEDQEMDLPTLEGSEDSSRESSFSKSTIVEVKYKVWRHS